MATANTTPSRSPSHHHSNTPFPPGLHLITIVTHPILSRSPSHHQSNKRSDNNTDKTSESQPSPTTTIESSGDTKPEEATTTNGDDIYRPPTPSHDIVHEEEEEEEGNKTPVYETPGTPDYSSITVSRNIETCCDHYIRLVNLVTAQRDQKISKTLKTQTCSFYWIIALLI